MSFVVALTLALQAQPAPDRDSVAIHRAAQAAQVRFERRRIDFLPYRDGSSWDSCDETIGRYCFTYGNPKDIYEPPPDSAPLVEARDQLIEVLRNAAHALPGDQWISSQRVRYLVEGKRWPDADQAAGACRPSGDWWCRALTAFALHGASRYAAADSAYAGALLAMPRDERCRWTDITLLLDGSPADYRDLPCETRDSLERRFWWLADPLYLVPGNERRTEHFSRWVMHLMQTDAVSPWGYAWGDDQRQILIRFGWPAGWSRSGHTTSGFPDNWAVSAGFREPRRAYEPPGRFVTSFEAIRPGAWTLTPPRPRGNFIPAYVARLDALPSQVAVFRRGAGSVVVAGYDLSQDSVAADAPAQAALVFLPGPEDQTISTDGGTTRARGTLLLETPPVGGLLSLEAIAPAARRAGRQRFWLPYRPLDGKPALSDLLLLSRADSLPRSLEAAAPLAWPNETVSPKTIGLFWEVYGLGPGVSPYSVGLTVVRESAGFLQRVTRSVGLRRQKPQVRLAWDEMFRPGTAGGSAIALDLSAATPGRYTIRLSIVAAGDSAVTERRITIK